MARTQNPRGGTPQAAGLAAGRGLLIVVFAVAVGFLLLARAVGSDSGEPSGSGGGSGSAQPANSQAPVTTVAVTTTAVTIPPKKQPQNVVVLVANGRGVAGAAKANADALRVQNYNVLSPVDYPTTEAATSVYFQADYQADAIAVAKVLNIDVAKVKEYPATPLPIDVKTAKVVVVLGADGQGISPS